MLDDTLHVLKLFMAKVEQTDGCWLWTASLDTDGYGRFSNLKRIPGVYRAHRMSLVLADGPIAPGLEVDHICGVRRCVRPSHLRAVPPEVNAANKVKINLGRNYGDRASCKQGHPFTESNTRRTATGARACRACIASSQRAYYRRKKTPDMRRTE